ncbi:MAG: redoxin domain-containing protein [Longimicrobiales bacterium]
MDQRHAQGGVRSAIRSWNEEGMMGLAIAGAAVCLMVALVGIGSAAAPDIIPVAGRSAVKLAEPAPNFQLRDLDGHLVSLSDLRGKVVLLNFWATWCGPCRVEMPAMEQLYRMFSRKDFEILAVSTDAQGVAVTRPFQQAYHLTFPILHDADYRVGLMYGARSLPMTFMVDRQGIVRHQIFGARDWGASEAQQLVQMLMKS